MSITNDLKRWLSGSYRGLLILILINVLLFFVVSIVDNISFRGTNQTVMSQWLILPGSKELFLRQPWTIFTYMFFHIGLLHLLSNMLWLYFMGRLFSDYIGSHKLIGTYILGGFLGGLLYFLLSVFAPKFMGQGVLLGASGGVMAVAVAVAAYVPDLTVRLFGAFDIKLKYLALIAFALTTLIDVSVNFGGKICHLGGAAFGLAYGFELARGGGFLDRMMSLFRKRNVEIPRKSKLRVEHRRPKSDEEFNTNKVSVQKRIDEILDKISRSGYESLSKDEKDFLFRWHDKH